MQELLKERGNPDNGMAIELEDPGVLASILREIMGTLRVCESVDVEPNSGEVKINLRVNKETDNAWMLRAGLPGVFGGL